MTPEATPYGTDAHPEVSEISDLTEGLLAVPHAQQVREHLAACPLCADVRNALQEIRSTLGTLPGPTRMPDDVTGRIDAALAAEAHLEAHRPVPVSRETAPSEPAGVSRETGTGPEKRRPTHAEPPPDSPPASRPHSRSGSTRPGRTPRPSGPAPGRQRERRSRRLRTLLTTAGVVGALVLGGALFQSLGPGPSGGPGADQSAAGESQSDGETGAMASERLEHRVQELLDQPPAPATSSPGLDSGTGQPEDTAPLVGGPTMVPSCVRAGIDRSEQPLAAGADQPYAGRPSYVVVLPHPGDRERVDAYVVDSSCTTDPRSGPGEVLLHRTYTRD